MAYVKQIDHSAFSGYSEEALYWCGILATDGCITLQKRGINFGVAYGTIDLEHVAKFRDFLKSDHKICIAEPRYTNFGLSKLVALIRFTSKEIGELLIENGITPRKSLGLRVSDKLAASPDFWRGAIDGDGCITTNGRGCPKVYLLSGSLTFIEQYCKFCETLPGVGNPLIAEVDGLKNRCYRAESYGSRARALLEVLWGNPIQALDSKRLLAINILAKVQKGGREKIALVTSVAK